MSHKLLLWNIYEASSNESSLNGVMLRGKIRKLGIKNGFNVLAENAEDSTNRIRFAVLDAYDAETIMEYLATIMDDVKIELVLRKCQNPVLSKLKVNDESRYSL